jgi:serine/threonine protein kinase
VIAYEMLTGQLPYGKHELTLRRLQRVRCRSTMHVNPDVPLWVDRALQRAVAIERNRRYTLPSEFVHDLAHPNPRFLARSMEPLIERNPLLFLLNLFWLLLLLRS